MVYSFYIHTGISTAVTYFYNFKPLLQWLPYILTCVSESYLIYIPKYTASYCIQMGSILWPNTSEVSVWAYVWSRVWAKTVWGKICYIGQMFRLKQLKSVSAGFFPLEILHLLWKINISISTICEFLIIEKTDTLQKET